MPEVTLKNLKDYLQMIIERGDRAEKEFMEKASRNGGLLEALLWSSDPVVGYLTQRRAALYIFNALKKDATLETVKTYTMNEVVRQASRANGTRSTNFLDTIERQAESAFWGDLAELLFGSYKVMRLE